jgi:hypothetical protein
MEKKVSIIALTLFLGIAGLFIVNLIGRSTITGKAIITMNKDMDIYTTLPVMVVVAVVIVILVYMVHYVYNKD